jgi:hypothetical protein
MKFTKSGNPNKETTPKHVIHLRDASTPLLFYFEGWIILVQFSRLAQKLIEHLVHALDAAAEFRSSTLVG